MALNPLLKKLVVQSAIKYRDADDYHLPPNVKRQQSKADEYSAQAEESRYRNALRAHEEWCRCFFGPSLPRISVLVRYPAQDRAAMIAHHRVREFFKFADEINRGDSYHASLTRKRLKRIEDIAQVFEEFAE